MFNETVEKFIKDIDVENNDEFLATIKILSATFGRKIRKLKPHMLELCWTRISSGLLISKDEEIKYYSRLTQHSGELVYFEMDIPFVISFINHMLNDINKSIQIVEEEIILAIRNQRLNDIETVFIDIFQYRDKFLETKNDKKPSKINSINTDLSTKIKSSLFISPGGDVRFRYSLLLKDQTIKFDSQYHSIIVLILHYLNQILNSLKNLEKIDLGLSLENLKEILFEFNNCQNNWDNINSQMNIENREEIEKKFKEEEFSKELSNTLLKVRIDNDDLEGALELGNKILEKYKDSYNTLLNLGLVYSKIGDQEKAIDFTNKALNSEEIKGNILEESRANYNLACYYALKKEFDKSIEKLKETITINPKFYYYANDDEDLKEIQVRIIKEINI